LNGETDSFLIWNVSIGRVGVVLISSVCVDISDDFFNGLFSSFKVEFESLDFFFYDENVLLTVLIILQKVLFPVFSCKSVTYRIIGNSVRDPTSKRQPLLHNFCL
jgi:hypothetical protein